MAEPLFIFGIARSGTNLIAAMLNGHSHVHLALDPLLPYFKALRDAWIARSDCEDLRARYPAGCPFQDYYFDPRGRRLLDLTLAGELDVPVADPQLGDRIAARAALESPTTAQRLTGMGGATFRELLDALLARLAQRPAALHWVGTKEVWTVEFIPALARAYPAARFIIIRRDPRAIIASLLTMARKDSTQAAHTVSYLRHWRKEAALVDMLQRSMLWQDRVLVLGYERLAADPATQLRAVAEFLALEIEPEMLDPRWGSESGATGNSSYGALEGISEASVDRWHCVLDADAIATAEYHCAPEMLVEGYVPRSAIPVPFGPGIRREVQRADAEPGSWRSDAADPQRDLESEAERWSMLQPGPGSTAGEDEIRRHFLFRPFFERLSESVGNGRRAGRRGEMTET